ncbi:NAD(P)-dependent oxidoreductase [Puniceicoccus vermicola]|uniref:NAD(P)-dependent oxidoreductase n=1 Tax=Puniceicoccus vermicola TaxID=388746 RepID=A0A7X1AX88_9BACT|nr:NAD(P)-dependent oxidoreductase [Puniceicoccus vermicola]MBC2601690.1 NAD(P)-dependent oxidoreductase [Puniceicoccus vermicola]
MEQPTISVLGLGIIGSIWAGHYSEAGVLAATWNRTPKPDFSQWVDSASAAAEAGEIVQLCLYDPDSVEEVLESILPVLDASKIVFQSSTIDPISAEKFAEKVRSTGARYVEAPFTGSKPAAEEKQTVYFQGGSDADLDFIEPILSLVSRKRFRFDTPTQAATIKLAMNHQISAITESLCEGIAWSRKAGLSDGQFFDVLRENVAWSGLAGLKEEKIREMDFSPQFSVRNMEKDMRLATNSAPLDLPSLALVRERLKAALEAGYGDDDFISLLRILP